MTHPIHHRPGHLWRFSDVVTIRAYSSSMREAALRARSMMIQGAGLLEVPGNGRVLPTFNYAFDEPLLTIWCRPNWPVLSPYLYRGREDHMLNEVSRPALQSIDRRPNGKSWWAQDGLLTREIPVDQVDVDALEEICRDLRRLDQDVV